MAEHQHLHDEPTQEAALMRLKRVEGQLRGIGRMMEKGAYCQDILNQIASVRSALGGLQQVIFHEHVETCIADKILKDRKAGTAEIIAILKNIR